MEYMDEETQFKLLVLLAEATMEAKERSDTLETKFKQKKEKAGDLELIFDPTNWLAYDHITNCICNAGICLMHQQKNTAWYFMQKAMECVNNFEILDLNGFKATFTEFEAAMNGGQK